MPFNKGRPTVGATPGADPILLEFNGGEFHFSDGTTAKLPPNIKYVEQDPEKVNMLQPNSEKAPLKVIVNDKVSFFLIQGSTKQTVLDGIRRCELGV